MCCVASIPLRHTRLLASWHVLVHPAGESAWLLDARALRAPHVAGLVVSCAFLMRGNTVGSHLCLHRASNIRVLAIIPIAYSATILRVRSCASHMPLETQFVLFFSHSKVYRSWLQLPQIRNIGLQIFDFMNNRIVFVSFPEVVLLVPHIRQFLNVRLQLFQQDQAERY